MTKYTEEQIRKAATAVGADGDEVMDELNKPEVTFREGEAVAFKYSEEDNWRLGYIKSGRTGSCKQRGNICRKLCLSEMPEEVERIIKGVRDWAYHYGKPTLADYDELKAALTAFDEVIKP